MTDTQPADTPGPVTFEDIVTGRLTLVALRDQLHTQIAGLRSQLAIAEAQLRQTEELLRRVDEKMAAEYPDAMALLEDSVSEGASEGASKGASKAPAGRRKTK
jgi:hypothetical protein